MVCIGYFFPILFVILSLQVSSLGFFSLQFICSYPFFVLTVIVPKDLSINSHVSSFMSDFHGLIRN